MINRDPTRLRPPFRSRRLLLIAGGVIIALILTLRSIAVFWTDFLWFDSIGQTGVWRTLIFTKVWLVLSWTGGACASVPEVAATEEATG